MAKRTAPQTPAGGRFRTPKMAELIADTLRRQIVRGELQEGAALPSEGVLMEQFGVSRPTLREAFRVIESEGLIDIQRGAHGGARVKSPDRAIVARHVGFVLEHRGTTLKDVFDARAALESACAGMAAAHRQGGDVEALNELYDRISDTDDVAQRIGLHAEFDQMVVAATHNETMIVLSSLLRRIIDTSTLESVLESVDSPATIKAYRDAHAAHRRLIDLIEAHDAEGAVRHWRRHLDLAQEFVLSTGVSGQSVLDVL